MKKLIYITTLTSIFFFNLGASYDSNSEESQIKAIKFAIGKSRPDLLKKALINADLTESERENCIIFAERKAQKAGSDLEFKRKSSSPLASVYRLASLHTIFLGTGIFTLSEFLFLAEAISNRKQDCRNPWIKAFLINAAVTPLSIILSAKKLLRIADKKDKEYQMTHRNSKQKYWDALEICTILKKT